MSQRVLIVYFSQTGQMRRVAESVAAPLQAGGVQLAWLPLAVENPYPFPWPFFAFFDEFPEATQGIAPHLQPFAEATQPPYDLIILAYTVWFLAPAPAITAFVQSPEGRALLRNTPVVTLVSCRNMWVMAQQKMKALLAAAGARHCDNVVLTDPSSSRASFITTPRWMLTGKTSRLWGMPPPGLTDTQIAQASRFGAALLAALKAGAVDGSCPLLTGLKAVAVDGRLLLSERIGTRSFQVWGKLVRLFGEKGSLWRRPALLFYAVFLACMIVTLVPLSMLIRWLLRPLMHHQLAAQVAYHERPSGSGDERMAEFLRP